MISKAPKALTLGRQRALCSEFVTESALQARSRLLRLPRLPNWNFEIARILASHIALNESNGRGYASRMERPSGSALIKYAPDRPCN